MSRPLNPCNCEQAKCYEALLRLAVEALRYRNYNPAVLVTKFEDALTAYEQATEEYEQEG
jgi:hypothetical protein